MTADPAGLRSPCGPAKVQIAHCGECTTLSLNPSAARTSAGGACISRPSFAVATTPHSSFSGKTSSYRGFGRCPEAPLRTGSTDRAQTGASSKTDPTAARAACPLLLSRQEGRYCSMCCYVRVSFRHFAAVATLLRICAFFVARVGRWGLLGPTGSF